MLDWPRRINWDEKGWYKHFINFASWVEKDNINLTVQKNNIKKQNKAIQKKLDNMVNQNQDYEKYVLRQQQMTQSENKYYSTIFQQIKSKVKDSTNIL